MGSGHQTARHRYGGRPFQTRPTLPIVIIVCDDTKTAVAYFTELKREVKLKVTVRIEAAPHCGAIPDDVVQHANTLAQKITPKQKDDSIWALLDMEAETYKQVKARSAKQKASGGQIQVLLSNPCYEVWTLAHFVATGEAFNGCSAVVARVKREWKIKFGTPFGNKKSQADYAKLMPHRSEAVKNAAMRNPNQDSSWSEVYKVVQAIQLLCEN